MIGHEIGAQKTGITMPVQDVPKVLGIIGGVPKGVKKAVIPLGHNDHPKTAGDGAESESK